MLFNVDMTITRVEFSIEILIVVLYSLWTWHPTCVSYTTYVYILIMRSFFLTEDEDKKFCLGLNGWCPCRVCSPKIEKKSYI